MSRLFRAALAALSLAAILGLPATTHAASPTKIAIIVGPVGTLTPTYLALADAAVAAAEQRGAVVARAYSPNATPANVLAAVADANVIIYFGHGYGHPSPYGGLNTAKQNGWALQGPRAHGTHGDGVNGELQYLGEDWIVANARPAPGFVMIYSNTCYAPGASEGGFAPASSSVAAQRVAYYSRKVFTMGGSAYFATDFDRGAADLLARLLDNRGATFGSAFASDPRYVPAALTSQAHPFSNGQSIWLHRSKYTEGPPNYWYAFAGNPDLSPLRAWDRTAPTATLTAPAAGGAEVHPGANISLQLSEPVNGIGGATLSLRDATGEAVPAAVSYEPSTHRATIDPESALALSGHYSVVVGAGVTDAAARPLPPATWTFSTRLDADPLSAALPVVLESGGHELLRFAADGSVAERQTVEVIDRRWLAADRRARLSGRPGSWFRLDDPAFSGWWVAESGRAHTLGVAEEAALVAGTRITLSPGKHALLGFGADATPASRKMRVAGGRVVGLDLRRIHEGRSFVRLADTEFAGAWIEMDAASAPAESAVRRVLSTEVRAIEARLVPTAGDRAAFRFDDAGRVIERRSLTAVELHAIAPTTIETRIVGGFRFAMIASGDLAGWALAELPDLQIIPIVRAPDAAD